MFSSEDTFSDYSDSFTGWIGWDRSPRHSIGSVSNCSSSVKSPTFEPSNILVTLEDSSLLTGFHFRKNSGHHRLPVIREGADETYEALFQVLKEVELLLKAWKKRTEHECALQQKRDRWNEEEKDEEECGDGSGGGSGGGHGVAGRGEGG